MEFSRQDYWSGLPFPSNQWQLNINTCLFLLSVNKQTNKKAPNDLSSLIALSLTPLSQKLLFVENASLPAILLLRLFPLVCKFELFFFFYTTTDYCSLILNWGWVSEAFYLGKIFLKPQSQVIVFLRWWVPYNVSPHDLPYNQKTTTHVWSAGPNLLVSPGALGWYVCKESGTWKINFLIAKL